ncbi:MAG: hypothetical protein ACTHYM_11570, partial [Actinomycetaceae bacterium]
MSTGPHLPTRERVARRSVAAMTNWPAGDSRRVQQTTNDIHALYELVSLTDERVAQMATTMDERFTGVDQRFDSIDERFTGVDQRLDAIDERFTTVDTRFDAIDERFTGVDARFDAIDERFTTVDTRFDFIDER